MPGTHHDTDNISICRGPVANWWDPSITDMLCPSSLALFRTGIDFVRSAVSWLTTRSLLPCRGFVIAVAPHSPHVDTPHVLVQAKFMTGYWMSERAKEYCQGQQLSVIKIVQGLSDSQKSPELISGNMTGGAGAYTANTVHCN